MNDVAPLFWDFLLTFLGLFMGFVVILALLDSVRDPHLLFLRPEVFTELQSYTAEERNRLLAEAVESAFRGARIFVPIASFTFWLAAGSAVAEILSDTWWMRLAISAMSLTVGIWLTSALARRRVRGHLRTH